MHEGSEKCIQTFVGNPHVKILPGSPDVYGRLLAVKWLVGKNITRL